MKPLLLLTISLILTQPLHAIWPFSSSPQNTPAQASQTSSALNGDEIVKEMNALINKKDAAINEKTKEIERLKGEGVVVSLRHINEVQQLVDELEQKDAQIEQGAIREEFFIIEYKKLCQTFMNNTHSLKFQNAFKILKKIFKTLPNDTEIPQDLKIAADEINHAMEGSLLSFEDSFRAVRRHELKKNVENAFKESLAPDQNS